MPRRWCFHALSFIAAAACARAREPVVADTFSFAVTARAVNSGEQWDAVVGFGEDSATTFRLWLERPHRATDRGTVLRAVMHRGDSAGVRYLFISFAPVFYDLPPPTSGSGALTEVRMPTERSDSLPLVLTVRSRSRASPWLAEARLANGGRFLMVLDDRTGRGEFRRLDPRGDTRVFNGIMSLLNTR